MKSVLSIDVAKCKSVVMLSDENGEVYLGPKEITHDLNSFNELREEIEKCNLEDITVFMESTSTYHLPIARYFKEHNYKTLIINSLTTKNNFDTLRKTKTDKEDCVRLAKLFYVNELKYHERNTNDIYSYLRGIVRQQFYLNDISTNCKIRFKRLLNLCFPELEGIFKKDYVFTDICLNFVKEYPHPDYVKDKRVDALSNLLYKASGRHKNYYRQKAEQIKEAAMNSYPGVSKDDIEVENLILMAKLVQDNNKKLEDNRTKMIEIAKQTPMYNILTSFIGIGEVFASELIGELGDITRFDNHKQLIAFCGLDPAVIQSGKSLNIHGAISKRGSKYARHLMFNISQAMVKQGHNYPNHPVYLYYLTKKAEGKHYYESLTACSTKILRMLFSMCKNETTFKIN